MLDRLNSILKNVDDFVWGLPLIILILAVGIFMTIRLKGLQIRKLPLAVKYMFEKETDGDSGEVSSFAALCTALSATIGNRKYRRCSDCHCCGRTGGFILDVDCRAGGNRYKIFGVSAGGKIPCGGGGRAYHWRTLLLYRKRNG